MLEVGEEESRNISEANQKIVALSTCNDYLKGFSQLPKVLLTLAHSLQFNGGGHLFT